MKHLFYIILISLFCFNITAFAQNPEWINYTNGDLINAIETEDDFIWVGTSVGLVKINKSTGNTIFFDKINSGLPENYITSIAIDDFGNKWIGTREGLTKYDGTNWLVYNISNSGLPDNYIQCIAIDKLGNKWIGSGEKYSDSGGLVKFDGTDWTVFNVSNSDLPSNRVTCIVIDEIGNKWIGTLDGLAKFDGTDWTFYNESNSDLPTLYITSLAIDEAGNKWIGTIEGLAKYDDTTWVIYNNLSYNIECLAIDSFDNIWIGRSGENYTDIGGLLKFDGSDWTEYNYNEENTGLTGKGISSIAIDTDGNKWIGCYSIYGYEITYGKGLVKFDDTNWTKINTSNSGLPNNYVRFITIDESGNK